MSVHITIERLKVSLGQKETDKMKLLIKILRSKLAEKDPIEEGHVDVQIRIIIKLKYHEGYLVESSIDDEHVKYTIDLLLIS